MRTPRLTFANVVSVLALFIALGGTSYAVTQLPKNSVGTAQVKNHSLRGEDLASGVLTSGPRGPRGSEGPAGAAGAAGAPGPSDAYTTTVDGRGLLSTQPNVPVTLAKLTSLPAGQYVLTAETDIANFNPGAEVSCRIVVNGTQLAGTNIASGTNASYVVIGPISLTTSISSTQTFDALLQCASNAAPADPTQTFAEQRTLTAIKVGALHVQ